MNKLFPKIQELYGPPKGYKEDRKLAYFVVDEETSEVRQKLTSVDKDVDVSAYIMPQSGKTIISVMV